MPIRTLCMRGLLLCLLAGSGTAVAADADATWAKLRPFFQPPAAFANDYGKYPAPLKFAAGQPVASAAEWPRRREEILAAWHREMGPWPKLLARPQLEFVSAETRAGVVQHRINLEVAPGVMQHGYLLVPRGAARRPAVLVPFYAPEPSIDYRGPPVTGIAARYVGTSRGNFRDFAWQLAQRGFVTLAIGSPGDNCLDPLMSGAQCQPLSYYAYIAANCHTLLTQRPEVDPARIGVLGHSYGGKWALFASCFHDKFAAAVWDDAGIVFDETQPNTNYWEPWYLGRDPQVTRRRGPLTSDSPRTGAYKRLVAEGHDLTEVHALMAPRPFLVAGGDIDGGLARWQALNHAVAVNRLLGHEHRVALTSRPTHQPTAESNELSYLFLEHFLGPVPPVTE